jgi:hypothetical protein
MQNAITQTLSAKFAPLEPFLEERTRRLWAAVEARTLGRGGSMRVAEATGLSRATIRAGLRELSTPRSLDVSAEAGERLRRPGGGRRALIENDPQLLQALEQLVDPVTRGDPRSHWSQLKDSPTLIDRFVESPGAADAGV